jgi:regulator of protease activity HflC (stomatin/prohibitin superfamily)
MMEWILLFLALIVLLVFVLPGIKLIRDDEVGIITRKMFAPMLPDGHIIATKGEVGIHSKILMPGLYYFFPIFWSVDRVPIVNIPPNNIGVVEAIDGISLPHGRILADDVECNSYQDATRFLDGGGYKGVQNSVLRPGKYRINTKVFTVRSFNSTVIGSEKIGIVTALDGISLPSNLAIAPAPTDGDHKHFQDGQSFINNSGYRGTQLETLQTGEYYINPMLFKVEQCSMAEVPAGYVAVIVSSVGENIEHSTETAPHVSLTPDLDQATITSREHALITNWNQRGIISDPVGPGKYNLNKVAYRAELVPTSAVTIKWGTRDAIGETPVLGSAGRYDSEKANEFYEYSQLKVTSKDGFQLEVDVKLIVRIPPENAPYVISRFGNIHNLIEQVVHPLIDSSFRNEAGTRGAMVFIGERSRLQEDALTKAREEFRKYHVEVQGLLIAYIKVDQALLDTQTKREIAVQQQEQYSQEAKAQESRIEVAEKTARADKQKDIIQAKLQIDINKDMADAARREAEGIRDSTKTKADGTAYEAQINGEGQAKAYEAQVNVLGKERIAILKVIEEIGKSKTKITPDILVTGGDGKDGGNNLLLNTFFAQMMQEKIESGKPKPENK